MTINGHDRATRILLVEDNKIDARLTRQAIQRLADWPAIVELVDDGEKAIRFLRREHDYSEVAKPDLVILDLNLPKCDGREVLQVIRDSEDLRNIVVFVFSSSPLEVANDRMSSTRAKPDRCFEKPNEVTTYFSIAQQFRHTYERSVGLRKSAAV